MGTGHSHPSFTLLAYCAQYLSDILLHTVLYPQLVPHCNMLDIYIRIRMDHSGCPRHNWRISSQWSYFDCSSSLLLESNTGFFRCQQTILSNNHVWGFRILWYIIVTYDGAFVFIGAGF